MAQVTKKRLENVPGDFYVDETCIDCDACRWIAPEIFHEDNGQSAVFHQPANDAERDKALQALISCPTSSIGAGSKTDFKKIIESFPISIEENIYYCGYHAESSYGAASYFIQRPEGNILIDSPRFAAPLVKRLEAMGGVRYLYLTHRDDVADHALFHNHYKCDRILHNDDVSSDTHAVEIKLKGYEEFRPDKDVKIIPVPGHTKGHSVLLYKHKYLFTGDHLAYSPERKHLIAFRGATWYSWDEQILSMERLKQHAFEWVLPGHGRRFHAPAAEMATSLQTCISWMKSK